MSLVTLFKQTIDRRPMAVAVVQGDYRYTYSDLGRLTANVAHYLQSGKVKPGDRVALLLPNSFEYIGIFYGIWTVGGVTVSLNTQAKARDIVNWVRHAGCKLLFIDGQHAELEPLLRLINPEISLIPVHIGPMELEDHTPSVWSEISNASSELPTFDPTESELASIIYTSGTTGHPKGVTLSHDNLLSNINSILQYLSLSESDSIVNILPFYYSYGNSVLHTHIAVGGKLILENSLLYPHQVVARIEQEQASGFSGVPSTFSLLLGRVKLQDYDLSSLRYITQAGGAMPPALTDKLLTALPDTNLFIMYGQTEATARLSYLPSDKIRDKRGSIGIAIPGVTIEIRDKNGNKVPPGVTGEICANGPNIMRGYWQDRNRTNQVIIDGWLHTGDLAHYDTDGYIFIDGRSSDMIKTGGNRISPKEVEEIIQEIEGVQEVAVVGIKDEMLGEVIKAYVVPSAGATIGTRAIQRHCKQNLAIYKIPKLIELIDDLPKTASGKVQRFVLQSLHEQTQKSTN